MPSSSQVLSEAVAILNERTDIDSSAKYFLLASLLMYLKTPLKNEAWNTFPKRLVSVREALFTTDEEKNPDFWNHSTISLRQKTQRMLFDQLVHLRDGLKRKAFFREQQSLIAIPDPSTPSKEPTLFPVDYLKKQVEKGNYINELTGHPLSWMVVEQVRSPNSLSASTEDRRVHRMLPPDAIRKLMLNDLEQLQKFQECCVVCRKKTRQFKTLHDYQTVFFCSLKCLGEWQMN